MAHLTPVHNRLITSLSKEDAALLIPQLRPIEFKVRHSFFKANQPIKTIVFPESGFASVVATPNQGNRWKSE